MEAQRVRTNDKMILAQAALSFRRSIVPQEVLSAVRFVWNNPEVLRRRLNEFDIVICELNQILRESEISPERYGNILKMKKLLGGRSLTDIAGYATIVQDNASFVGGHLIPFGIEMIFNHIGKLLQSGEWDWVVGYPPAKMASALLITGYGEMLEVTLKIPDLKQVFFLAFEEILIDRTESKLLTDVLPAMEEEISDFSSLVQEKIMAIVAQNKE